MNSPESLIRLIFWLWKKDWGIAFLLALASFIALLFLPSKIAGAMFEGRVFRAGFYIGTLCFPDWTTRGSNGSYLVPLFGASANFFFLMTFWWFSLQVLRWMRSTRSSGEM